MNSAAVWRLAEPRYQRMLRGASSSAAAGDDQRMSFAEPEGLLIYSEGTSESLFPAELDAGDTALPSILTACACGSRPIGGPSGCDQLSLLGSVTLWVEMRWNNSCGPPAGQRPGVIGVDR